MRYTLENGRHDHDGGAKEDGLSPPQVVSHVGNEGISRQTTNVLIAPSQEECQL
jgi:hypothetical protein